MSLADADSGVVCDSIITSVPRAPATEHLLSIQRLAASLGRATTVGAVADAIVEHILPVTHASVAIVALLDEDCEHLTTARMAGCADEVRAAWTRFPVTAPLAVAVAVREDRTVVYESRVAYEGDYPEFASVSGVAAGARLAAPMRLNGHTLGGIGLAYERERLFEEGDVLFVETVALLCAQALERARLHEEDVRSRLRLDEEHQRLVRTNERLHLTHSAVGVGTWEWDIVGSQVVWSPEYREVYGLDADAEPGFEQGMAAVLPEDRELVAREIGRCLDGMSDFRTEHRIRHPRKGLRWIASLGRAVRDAEGRPVRLVGIVWDCTEQHAAGEALRRSEERYRALVASTSSILWTADHAGAFVDEQPSWAERTGQTWEQYRGWGRIEAVHPDDRQRVLTDWQRAVADGRVYETQERIWHAGTQAYRWYRVRGVPVRHPDGSVREWVGSMEDIHDQALAADAARESEALFRSLVDANVLGILTADGERLVEANDLLLDVLGYDRAELQTGAITWERLATPGNEELDARVLRELDATGRVGVHERLAQRKDGRRIPVLFGAALVRRDPVLLVGYVVDLTTTRAAEEALRVSEERLRLAVEGASIGTTHWDVRTNRYAWTGSNAAIYGFAPDEEITADKIMARVHPEDRERAANRVRDLIAGHDDAGLEYRVVWPDGSVHWVLTRGRVYRGATGEPERYEGIIQNIDARKQAETEIAALNERLTLSVQEIHHRVKNNLQFILAMLDITARDGDGAIPAEDARRIVSQVQTLARVHDLLTREAKSDRIGESVSARTVIESLVEMLETSCGRPVERRIDEVPLDIQRLTSLALVIAELVSNAAKHGDGGIVVALERSAPGQARLSVSNAGGGFPDGFDAGRDASTGLMITQRIVTHDLKGSVRFENAPDGARVTVDLPL